MKHFILIDLLNRKNTTNHNYK